MKCKIFKYNYFAVILVIQLIRGPLMADDITNAYSRSKDISVGAKGSEYISGDYPGAVLMKVNLWGSVGKTGIHFIPVSTDLITLLSYAGGPNRDALLDKVIIERRLKGHIVKIDVDIDDLLSEGTLLSPKLEPNDIVIIPAEKPLVGSNTLMAISLITSVLGIIAASIALTNK